MMVYHNLEMIVIQRRNTMNMMNIKSYQKTVIPVKLQVSESYSNLSHINIHCYLKHQIPIMHRHFFKKTSQNPEYIQTHYNKLNNPE